MTGHAANDEGRDAGMIGLGVMGRNLLINMAGHGFSVAGYDTDPRKLALLAAECPGALAAGTLDQLTRALRSPRTVILLVPAGPPVDAVLHGLVPLLQRDDIVVDGGNSHFTDTDRRAAALAASGIVFFGTGISGGERGAREGPSIMPGGPRGAYARPARLFEAIAAKVDGEPCVAYLGTGSAGHYTKMVHNGIEYALMELIAEAYDLMRRGLGLGIDEARGLFEEWNRAELRSFLLEITAQVLRQPDDRSDARLVDRILDEARQKGTGRWVSQDAMELGVPVPTIDAAVTAREMSALRGERIAASKILGGPAAPPRLDRALFIPQLRGALTFSWLTAFAQGMALLRAASEARGYGIPLPEVARIWRGGCIIRATLLAGVRRALEGAPPAPNILADPELSREILARQADARAVVAAAALAGIPAPAFMASLAYFDAYRSDRLPANLIQAQRDLFGAHTYERVDASGTFHTRWDDE